MLGIRAGLRRVPIAMFLVLVWSDGCLKLEPSPGRGPVDTEPLETIPPNLSQVSYVQAEDDQPDLILVVTTALPGAPPTEEAFRWKAVVYDGRLAPDGDGFAIVSHWDGRNRSGTNGYFVHPIVNGHTKIDLRVSWRDRAERHEVSRLISAQVGVPVSDALGEGVTCSLAWRVPIGTAPKPPD